ncbi:unnamed protein product [Cylindrotheca closterium]|uniref:Uncharacterized protein n=1 Tax=Cylindrotheca closterium TaxID=2856 RepID=A0AAD2JGN8_9STRA|nr:unnamed protein product [Cylindrotheca closterium]
MISLQDTLKLNNQAVELYHSDDFAQAAKAYYKSLCSMNKILKGCYDHADVMVLAANSTSAPQQECLHCTSFNTTTTHHHHHQHQEEPFLYQRPIVLQESAGASESLCTMQAMTIYCSGVLLNTAILHHQEAILTGSSASVDRAAKLYEASLHLVGKFHVYSGSNKTVSLIVMAASNNLAQIELQKGILDQACKRLQVLKSLIRSLQNVIPHIFTREEFGGMLSNSLSAESVIASPAA